MIFLKETKESISKLHCFYIFNKEDIKKLEYNNKFYSYKKLKEYYCNMLSYIEKDVFGDNYMTHVIYIKNIQCKFYEKMPWVYEVTFEIEE